MNRSEQRQGEARREHTEAIIVRHVDRLFQRLPMLSGFWVKSDLDVAELSAFTWPGYTPGREFYDAVRQALIDLAEERPEAVELIRGRTIARAMH